MTIFIEIFDRSTIQLSTITHHKISKKNLKNLEIQWLNMNCREVRHIGLVQRHELHDFRFPVDFLAVQEISRNNVKTSVNVAHLRGETGFSLGDNVIKKWIRKFESVQIALLINRIIFSLRLHSAKAMKIFWERHTYVLCQLYCLVIPAAMNLHCISQDGHLTLQQVNLFKRFSDVDLLLLQLDR